MSRALFAINCFGAGVFFSLIGCRLDAGLPVRNPGWLDAMAFALLAATALIALSRRAM